MDHIVVIGLAASIFLLMILLLRSVKTQRLLAEANERLENMAIKQTEVAADVVALGSKLDAANVKLTKIGTETDGLQQKIKELEDALANQDNATPELVAAVEGVKASVAALEATLTVVDDKVVDPPVPPTP